MRIVHTSDWHAGRAWKGVNRLPELEAVLDGLARFAERERVDLLLMTGDVFDTTMPAPHAEGVVFRFFKRIGLSGTRSIVIAGNHDQPSRLEAWGDLAELVGVATVGTPRSAERGGVLELGTRSGETAVVAALPFAPTRLQLETVSQELSTRSALRQRLQRELTSGEEEQEGAQRVLEEASRALALANQALREAEHAEMAHVLREGMEGGDPCPVCFRIADEAPLGPEPVSVAEARSVHEQARLRAIEAEGRVRCARERATDARTRLELAREEERRTEWARLELQLQITGAEQALDAVVPGEGRAEERLASQLAEHVRLREARRSAEARVLQAEKDQLMALAQRDRLLDQLGSVSAEAEREARLCAEAAQEAHALDQRLTEVGIGSGDPAVERLRVEAEIEGLVQAERSAEAALAAACAAFEIARARHESARFRLDAAQCQVLAAEQAFEEALAHAGFADVVSLERARLPEEALQAGLERLRTYEVTETALAAQLGAAREGLGTERISEEQVARADDVHARAAQALEAAVGREATATHVWSDLAERVSRSLALTEQRDALSGSARRYRRLATDLRANGFPAWLLSNAFSALVAGASARLREFTGRYTLCWDAQRREIAVVDHDNADEIRRAETLSGGETFLASLALALELSEQVQRAAGSVRLDSLFIDEGFGTLDPETLDAVAGAIEALSASDRMVGIITHVGSLTERLPTRLEVNRRAEGSSVVRVA